MTELLMIVPSKGRPENITNLLRAWASTTVGMASLLVVLDHDTEMEEFHAYQDTGIQDWPGADLMVIRPDAGGFLPGHGPGMVSALNEAVRQHAADHFAVGFMGDDHFPRTKGWDHAFVDALEQLGTGLVYGNDLIHGANLPTAVAMTSDIPLALGYMAPPVLRHLYVDDFWLALGRGTGRIRYLGDQVIEHMHPIAGKAPTDEGYERVNSARMYEEDRRAWTDFRESGQLAEAVTAVDALGGKR
jgi:hypothetical protein